MAAIPLAIGYGIGRLGCLLAGDGTYGKPSDLPWAISFPDGVVLTLQQVHPAPAYEALAAFVIALLLWRMRDRVAPDTVRLVRDPRGPGTVPRRVVLRRS